MPAHARGSRDRCRIHRRASLRAPVIPRVAAWYTRSVPGSRRLVQQKSDHYLFHIGSTFRVLVCCRTGSDAVLPAPLRVVAALIDAIRPDCSDRGPVNALGVHPNRVHLPTWESSGERCRRNIGQIDWCKRPRADCQALSFPACESTRGCFLLGILPEQASVSRPPSYMEIAQQRWRAGKNSLAEGDVLPGGWREYSPKASSYGSEGGSCNQRRSWRSSLLCAGSFFTGPIRLGQRHRRKATCPSVKERLAPRLCGRTAEPASNRGSGRVVPAAK